MAAKRNILNFNVNHSITCIVILKSTLSILLFNIITLNLKGQCSATYTDTINKILHDGKNCVDYPIVKIADQWWMAKNVNGIYYSDGSPLLNGVGVAVSKTDFTSKYYFHSNNDSLNDNVYGKLYTWAAAMNGAPGSKSNPSGIQGVCPVDWHVPADAEWKQLEMNLGMSQGWADAEGYRGTDEGCKLKESGLDHWLDTNTCATNSTGFTGVAAGDVLQGIYYHLGIHAHFWTATEADSADAFSRLLDHVKPFVNRGEDSKPDGFAVRCVGNKTFLHTDSLTAVKKIDAESLVSISPNPANSDLTIRYTLPENSIVKIDLYNSVGLLVKEFSNQYQKQDHYFLRYDVRDLPVGLYLVSFSYRENTCYKRVLIIRE